MLTASILSTFRKTCVEHRLHVYGVHLYQEGQGSVRHMFRSDDRVHLWSASKTFTSLAVGICLDERRFSLSDHILSHFPQYTAVAAPGTENITIRDLLQMRSGKEYEMFDQTDPVVLDRTDWAKLFFAEPLVTEPGTHFYYSNPCTYMLSRLVERTTGQTTRDFLMPRLFGPLGILNPWWATCSHGHTIGAYGLHLKLDEFAPLGRLLLQDGVWNGHALVSSQYIEAMRTDTVDCAKHVPGAEWNMGYGYQIWRCTRPETYRADGRYGQLCIVLPDLRAVVTITGHNESRVQDTIAAVFADIVPKLA
jgi:CubicO group peptidase (beta-lactamase class C family)